MNVATSKSNGPIIMKSRWLKLVGVDKWAAMTDEWIALQSEFNPWWQ